MHSRLQCENEGGTGQTAVAEGEQIEGIVNSGLEDLLAQWVGPSDGALGPGKVYRPIGCSVNDAVYDSFFFY